MVAADGYEDHYLIEADLGTEGPTALSRKLALYRQLYQSGAEQEATGMFPSVVFVTLEVRRAADIAKQLSRQPAEYRPIFTVSHLSRLTALLIWGPEQAVR